jgi:hypothetical protein
MTVDPTRECLVCSKTIGAHLVYFVEAIDPQAELAQRFNYGKPIQCPGGLWTTWRKALGDE